MRVSVCILTWNCLNVLRDSFEHLYYEVEALGGEIVIIDNGSDDGTRKFIVKQYAKGYAIKYYRFPENAGISKGKNKGIEMAEGDYIVLLDGDVDPTPNSIKMLVEYMDETPSCDALGFYPNSWSRDRNNFGQKNYEEYCHTLWDPKPINRCCIYYGIFSRSIFDDGLRMNEEGEFGKAGYGWEDFDFYNRMQKMGIIQYVAGMNHENGKYYHNINSSIRAMGRKEYIRTSQERNKEYKKSWKSQLIGILKS